MTTTPHGRTSPPADHGRSLFKNSPHTGTKVRGVASGFAGGDEGHS